MNDTCASCVSGAGSCTWQVSTSVPPAFPPCCSGSPACVALVVTATSVSGCALGLDGGPDQLCPLLPNGGAPSPACQLSRAWLPLPSPVGISCYVGFAFAGAGAAPTPSPFRSFAYCYSRSYTCVGDPSASTSCPDGASNGTVVRELFGAPLGVGFAYPAPSTEMSRWVCNSTNCNGPAARDPCAAPVSTRTSFLSAAAAFIEGNQRASLAALLCLLALLVVPWRLGWWSHCRVRLCGQRRLTKAPPYQPPPLPTLLPALLLRPPVGVPPHAWAPAPGEALREALPPGWARRGECGGGDFFYEDPKGRLVRCRRGTLAGGASGGWARVGGADALGDQAWLSPQGCVEICRKGAWAACPGAAAVSVAVAAAAAAAAAEGGGALEG